MYRLLSKVTVTFACSFTSNVQCVHIAAGRRIQAVMSNVVISETLQQFAPPVTFQCSNTLEVWRDLK